MKLQELKARAWNAWKPLNSWKGDLLQPEQFQGEVKRFGDRRYKSTWRKALAYFEALLSYHGCLDAYNLILNDFNFSEKDWSYELRHEIFDAFISLPEGLELIKLGLEQILSSDFTDQDRENIHGVLELVGGQQERRVSLPIGYSRWLTGDSSATSTR